MIDLVTLIRVLSFQLSVTDESLDIFHHNFPVNHNQFPVQKSLNSFRLPINTGVIEDCSPDWRANSLFISLLSGKFCQSRELSGVSAAPFPSSKVQ